MKKFLIFLLISFPIASDSLLEDATNKTEEFAFTSLITEGFETDNGTTAGEGITYRSNSFDDGANDFWTRTNTSPEPGSGNNQTYTGKTGTFFWNGEDLEGTDNPLNPPTNPSFGYVMIKTLDVSTYAGGTGRVSIDIAADNNGNGAFELADFFKIQYAFDADIATSANSADGLPTVANVSSGTYTDAGAFWGNDGATSTSDNYLSQDDSSPLDGTGDRVNILNNTFTTYTFDFAIPGGASNMSIRFVTGLDQGGEVLAFDNIQILAEAGVAAPSSATVAATVFLEGAYNGANLNTTLNASIPTTQPYSINSHAGAETAGSIPAGAVDWVLVELREAASAGAALNATKVGSAAGFLMSDGTIKATNGTSDLTVSLSGNTGADFYVVIYHRNHLPIMSANAISASGSVYTIDFTSASANTYQTTTALASLSGGKFGLPAGDTDGDGDVDATDLATWRSGNGAVFNYGVNGAADFNLDGVINAVDRNGFHRKNTAKTRQVPST